MENLNELKAYLVISSLEEDYSCVAVPLSIVL